MRPAGGGQGSHLRLQTMPGLGLISAVALYGEMGFLANNYTRQQLSAMSHYF